MRYIITENQALRLKTIILNFLDENLTPGRGWESKKTYKEDVERHDEIFFMFDPDSEGSGDDAHMWYSVCDNHNLHTPLNQAECPVVSINSVKYDTLDGYFGSRWIELFRRWFTEHTGLPVVKIERQDW